MAQYIPKDALVAKIEKRLDEYSSKILRHYDACTEARVSELGKILVILNTFEVKDVDLKREIDKIWDNTSDAFSEDGWKEFEEIAKYFFELGLQAQKGE